MSVHDLVHALAAEAAAVGHFIHLLDEEGLALARRAQPSVLAELTRRKRTAADELADLAMARDAALRAAGFAAGHPGGEAAAAADPAVATVWTALTQAALAAKALNERNGAIVRTYLRSAQTAEAALRAATSVNLYGADGRHTNAARSHAG